MFKGANSLTNLPEWYNNWNVSVENMRMMFEDTNSLTNLPE
jgi:hypothetical protein